MAAGALRCLVAFLLVSVAASEPEDGYSEFLGKYREREEDDVGTIFTEYKSDESREDAEDSDSKPSKVVPERKLGRFGASHGGGGCLLLNQICRVNAHCCTGRCHPADRRRRPIR
eukprot:TRINITY_DN5629_c0_g1_i1.p1 TRINITY_DN5629_c0_g1~~TRINITY_DN5629_c0_g1_i1.p1  ORF type:complete len:134 (+),score=14.03 TRINITY_DN5629_c0_g1_i1:58-402(+)